MNVFLGVMALECSGGYQSDQIGITMLVIALLSTLAWFPAHSRRGKSKLANPEGERVIRYRLLVLPWADCHPLDQPLESHETRPGPVEVRGRFVDNMRTRAQNGPQSSQGSSKPVPQARASFGLSSLKFSVSHSTFTAPNHEESHQ